jgi:hypothetical protein
MSFVNQVKAGSISKTKRQTEHPLTLFQSRSGSALGILIGQQDSHILDRSDQIVLDLLRPHALRICIAAAGIKNALTGIFGRRAGRQGRGSSKGCQSEGTVKAADQVSMFGGIAFPPRDCGMSTQAILCRKSLL